MNFLQTANISFWRRIIFLRFAYKLLENQENLIIINSGRYLCVNILLCIPDLKHHQSQYTSSKNNYRISRHIFWVPTRVYGTERMRTGAIAIKGKALKVSITRNMATSPENIRYITAYHCRTSSLNPNSNAWEIKFTLDLIRASK